MLKKSKNYSMIALLVISLNIMIASVCITNVKGDIINGIPNYEGYELIIEEMVYDVEDVKVSGNGQYVSVVSRGKLSFYNLSSHTPKSSIWDFSVTSGMYKASMSNDGKYIVTAGSDSSNTYLYLFDNEKTGNLYLDSFLIGSNDEQITDLSISNNSDYIVVGLNKASSSEIWYFNHSIKGTLVKIYNSLIPNILAITDIEINENGSIAIVGGNATAKYTYVYNSSSSSAQTETYMSSNVTSLAISPDGSRALAGCVGDAYIINTNINNSISQTSLYSSAPIDVSITGDGNYFYVAGGQYSRCYLKSGSNSGISQWMIQGNYEISYGKISTDGNYAIHGEENMLYFINSTLEFGFFYYDLGNPVTDVKISDDGAIVVASTKSSFYVFKFDPLYQYEDTSISGFSVITIVLTFIVCIVVNSIKVKKRRT